MKTGQNLSTEIIWGLDIYSEMKRYKYYLNFTIGII